MSPRDVDARAALPDGGERPRRPAGIRRARLAVVLEPAALSRATATSCSCPTRAAATAGARHSRARNVKDFGGGDLRDILAGVDEVVKTAPGGRRAHRHHRLELRRLHDDVGGDPDRSASARRWPAPASRTGRATTARTASPQWMIPYFGAIGLRRSRGLREELAHQLHQERRRRRR